MSTRSRWIFIALKGAVSALFVYVILRQIGGFSALWAALRGADLMWCVAGATAALLHILLSGVNIWLLLKAARTSVPFIEFLRLYIYSYCFGLVLPGQAGDAVITVFLKREGVPYSASSAAYVVDKCITFGFMILVGVYGFAKLAPDLPGYLLAVGALVASGVGGGALAWISRANFESPRLKKIQSALAQFSSMLLVVGRSWGFLALNVSITVIKWGIIGLSYFMVFRALGAEVPWPMVGVIPIMSTFVGYVPISIAGVGTVEYSAVYLFSLIGVSDSTVFSTYLIQRTIQYLLAGALVLIFFVGKMLGQLLGVRRAVPSRSGELL